MDFSENILKRYEFAKKEFSAWGIDVEKVIETFVSICLLYTSDAADEL